MLYVMCILPECVLMSAGPLCAGMGGKKKKKMMYLTTKNAGKHRLLASALKDEHAHILCCCCCDHCCLFNEFVSLVSVVSVSSKV